MQQTFKNYKKSFFKRAKKTLAKGQSFLQDIEIGPLSSVYFLVVNERHFNIYNMLAYNIKSVK